MKRQIKSLPINPLLRLTPFQLERLLDICIRRAKAGQEIMPDYYRSALFIGAVKEVKREYASIEELLSEPQVILAGDASPLSTSYNQKLVARVTKKLSEFGDLFRGNRHYGEFSFRFMTDRRWVEYKQVQMLSYLAGRQSEYIETQNPLKLQPVYQEEIAKHLGCDSSTVSRLAKNLTVRMPDGRVTLANEFMPGAYFNGIRVLNALLDLSENPAYFADGRWKLADRELQPPIREMIGYSIARRTVAKYSLLIEQMAQASSAPKAG